jgi:aminoglycoside 6'-N-acetyltransferase
VTVSIRAATPGDVDFLAELYAGRPYDRDSVAAQVAQEPAEGGLIVIELDGDQAGAMAWQTRNDRSRIVHVSGVAVHPRSRGRRVADDAARLLQRHLIEELGFHRIELEIYGFNERAQRHVERSGFVREGVKRKAYRREDGWADGVLYGFVAEDLDEPR